MDETTGYRHSTQTGREWSKFEEVVSRLSRTGHGLCDILTVPSITRVLEIAVQRKLSKTAMSSGGLLWPLDNGGRVDEVVEER